MSSPGSALQHELESEQPDVKYTTSAPASSLSQCATSPSGWPSSSAWVALTVASSTGTCTGSSSTGKSSSRARTCAVMAAKSVPTAASPIVPRASTTASGAGRRQRSTS